MPSETPLWDKLYSRPAYSELARSIGYDDVPAEEAQGRMQKLVERFGTQAMKAVSDDLIDVVKSGETQIARLKPHVRKLCYMLLGPPKEDWDRFYRYANGQPGPLHAKKMAEIAQPTIDPPKPETKTKKPRQKKPKPFIMDQFYEYKERHPGMLLLFRVGDFYELFHEDADAAAKILGLTLTTRDKTIPMAGFPHHQLESYLKKLLQEGKRVAVCELADHHVRIPGRLQT